MKTDKNNASQMNSIQITKPISSPGAGLSGEDRNGYGLFDDTCCSTLPLPGSFCDDALPAGHHAGGAGFCQPSGFDSAGNEDAFGNHAAFPGCSTAGT